jgi:hypothetical protein
MAAKATEINPLRSILDAVRPGAVSCFVGGEEKEGKLIGGTKVMVPLTADGLPEAQEILRRGWESKKGTKVVAAQVKGSKLLGRYKFPVIVDGVVRYLEGGLMAYTRPNVHFTLSTAKPATWTVVNDDGTKEERTSYIPVLTSKDNDPQFNSIRAQDQDFEALMGQIVAHQMGIELV